MDRLFRPLSAVLLVAALALAVFAQSGGPPEAPAPIYRLPRAGQETMDETTLRLKREMEKKRNQERHEELKRDTEKLHELATKLKKEVDESDENMLSLNVIRTAEEIEKLAKEVKKKMKGD